MKLLEKQSRNSADYIVKGETIHYCIEGENTEILKVDLEPSMKKPFYGDPSLMVYIQGDVESEDLCLIQRRNFLEHKYKHILGILKRLIIGECICVTRHRAGSEGGSVGYAGNCPGNILPLRLNNETILTLRDVFMASFGNFNLSVDLCLEPALIVRGRALLMEKVSGDGIIFLQSGGDLFDVMLKKDEILQAEYGSVVAWEETVDFTYTFSDFGSAFSGKGMFMNVLTGPGRVIIQTMSIPKMKNCLHSTSFSPLPFMVMDSVVSRIRRILKIGL